MATVFEYPGGNPRYYTFKEGERHLIYEHGTGRAAFYVRSGDNTIFNQLGQPVFYIENGWLLRYDGEQSSLYFGEPIDGEPNPGE